MERHSISKLIGSPPGYVGFGDGQSGSGLLTNAVETHPHCVLLLDEIEKAHPDVFNLLLQIMDDGRLTNSSGKTVNFTNVILILTTNAGAAANEGKTAGFGRSEKQGEDDKAINGLFTPEFRNRLDAVIKFTKLKQETMIKIVGKFLQKLDHLAANKHVTIEITDAAKNWLALNGFDPKFGARPLGRVIQQHIKKPLSREMLFGFLKEGGHVTVDVKDNTIVLSPAAKVKVRVKARRKTV